MARYVLGGLIQSIRGRVGDLIFSNWRGEPVVYRMSSKKKCIKTEGQKMMEGRFTELMKGWGELSLSEQGLWGVYSRKWTKCKTKDMTGIMHAIGGKMSGLNAYVSANQLLLSCGFSSVRLPHLNAVTPPLASTDLVQYGVYEGVVRFNIWLERSFSDACRCQIWVRYAGRNTFSYVSRVVPVSTTPTEVVIEKLKLRVDGKRVEKRFRDIGKCRLYLQYRIISERGTFSMPSALYKIEVMG